MLHANKKTYFSLTQLLVARLTPMSLRRCQRTASERRSAMDVYTYLTLRPHRNSRLSEKHNFTNVVIQQLNTNPLRCQRFITMAQFGVWLRTGQNRLPVLQHNWWDEGNNDRANLPKLWLKEPSGRTRYASHHRQNIQCTNYVYGIGEVNLVMWAPEKKASRMNH